jgi:hypothetical protein
MKKAFRILLALLGIWIGLGCIAGFLYFRPQKMKPVCVFHPRGVDMTDDAIFYSGNWGGYSFVYSKSNAPLALYWRTALILGLDESPNSEIDQPTVYVYNMWQGKNPNNQKVKEVYASIEPVSSLSELKKAFPEQTRRATTSFDASAEIQQIIEQIEMELQNQAIEATK